MDQKRLRELMKKEKEQRAGSRPAPVRPAPGAGRPGATVVRRLSVEKAVHAVPAAINGHGTSTSSTSAAREVSATPAASGGLLGGYGDDSDEEVPSAPEKRQRTNVDALAMPPPAVPASAATSAAASAATAAGRDLSTDARAMPPPTSSPAHVNAGAAADAAAMPPPPVLPARRGASSTPSEMKSASSTPSELKSPGADALVPYDAPACDTEPDPDLAVTSEVDEDVQGDPDEAEPEPVSVLPEGFFDDPDADARARGVEAPAAKNARELEEGLKRFEKEMIVETEKAAEARYDIDEERYEVVAAEEQELQGALARRLEALKKKQLDKLASAEAAAAKPADEASNAADTAEGDDSGSDVDFDWRAKGFAS